MVSFSTFRSALFLLAGLIVPLLLTQCKTSAKSYKDISYDPVKLKTPSGHGLERKDYPFDESGAYRKDWVKNNTSGRDGSASPKVESTAVVADAGTSSTAPTVTSYPTYAEAAAARASGGEVDLPQADPSTGTAAILASASEGTMQASAVELASAGLESATPAPAPLPTSYHKVGSGDTLFALAGKYNTSVPELKRVNGLSGDNIRVGQSLRIP